VLSYIIVLFLQRLPACKVFSLLEADRPTSVLNETVFYLPIIPA